MGRGFLGRTFNFIEKDPEIDVWRTEYQKLHIKESDLAICAGLAVSTVKNMFGGKTRRPQFITYQKLAGAVGKRYGLVDDHKVDFAKEIPKAREEYKAHKAALAKKRERARKRSNGK